MTEASLYWIATALLSLLYLSSSLPYLTRGEKVRQIIIKVGYPGYLVQVLIIFKLLAVAAILSRISAGLSDLDYAGMFYHLALAVLAHVGARDIKAALPAGVCLALIAGSFLTQNAAREMPSPYAPFEFETERGAR